MAKFPNDGILFSINDEFRIVKCSSFIDEVNSFKARGFTTAVIYQINKSLYVRLIRIGDDGFVKKSIVLRSYPCSERTQRSLIVRL